MDYRELAGNIRSKYPGVYDDLDDRGLAEKIVAKYPAYSDTTFDDQPANQYGVKDAVGDIARPLLEGGGAVAAGMMAAPLGPVAAAGGGALGFAAGKSAADLLDRGLGRKPMIPDVPSALKETGNNLVAGAEAEATGQVAGRVIPSVLKGAGNLGAKFGEWATAIPEKDFHVVANNPTSILPGTLKKAGANFETAMRNAGISSELTPEAVDRMRQPGQYAFDTFNKLKTEGTITPQEALHARQSIDAVYPVPNNKNGSFIRMLDEIRDTFQKVISSASPELQAASKDYAIAKSGERFQSAFPRTKSGKPAYFRTGAILAGVASGRPEALFGIPAVAGVTTAAAGKAASVTSSIFGNPATRRLLAGPIGEAEAKVLGQSAVVDGGNDAQASPESENNAASNNQIVNGSLKQGSPKVLTDLKAREYLKRANGDKAKARQLATYEGWKIPK